MSSSSQNLAVESPLATSPGASTESENGRYVRLDRVDQHAAETLNQFFKANSKVQRSGGDLADLAVMQSLVTALPLVLVDFLALYLSVFWTTGVLERLMDVPTTQVEHQTAFFISLVIIPVARLAGLYPGVGDNPIVEFRQIARSLLVSLLVLAGLGWFCFPQQWHFYCLSAAAAFVVALPTAICARFFTRRLCKHCSWWGVPTLILAEPAHGVQLYRRLQKNREQGFRPCGLLLAPEELWSAEPLDCGSIPTYDVRSAEQVARELGATLVVVSNCANGTSSPAFESALSQIPNRVLLSSKQMDLGIWDHLYTVDSRSGLRLAAAHHNSLELAMKRVIDVAGSLAVLVLGAPFWLALCLLIRCTSPGQVIYGQLRIGKGGRPFRAWKFRSMYANADQVLEEYLRTHPEAQQEWDETHKLARDPRITPIGRLLRSTSLDELPQLWNILLGKMSLVGPRPIVDSPTYDATYIRDYPAEFEAYKSVRPGLTGLWQVRCRNRGVYEMRIFYDMYYIRNWCIWLDLYLIMRTVRTVLLREGT